MNPFLVTRAAQFVHPGSSGFPKEGERAVKDKFLPVIRDIARNSQLVTDDFHARGTLLCNSARDSYYSRFSLSALDEIAELLPGRPVGVGHRHDKLPVATYFSAKRVFIPDGRSPRRDNYWVEALYYFPRDPEGDAMAKRIDMGIYRETSVGWRCLGANCSLCGNDIDGPDCDHIPGELYRDGLAEYEFSGVTNVLEGSLVMAGGQKNTSTFNPERGHNVEDMHLASIFGGAYIARDFPYMKQRSINAKGGDERSPRLRRNVASLVCSRERFESIREAAAFVRYHEWRADKHTETDMDFRFTQQEGQEQGSAIVDEGVVATLLADTQPNDPAALFI